MMTLGVPNLNMNIVSIHPKWSLGVVCFSLLVSSGFTEEKELF